MRIGTGVYEANARLPIEKLEQALGYSILTESEENEFDTLGGLLFFELGHVPARGEVVNHSSGLKFEILEADPRRIHRVKITQTKPPEEA